jgi:hypothetical protein
MVFNVVVNVFNNCMADGRNAEYQAMKDPKLLQIEKGKSWRGVQEQMQ